ncbi:MAG: HlyD family efflux transporter periplasmic adaptor subunit [Nevskiaceae bacterium]|nr:MAG: HlyD family efflux transporter periplasmic adaptor subunit [Nevskiaceae bacterium]TBR73347.1 MAG: HlyD family efflux transporter periplasmic adaptor subunit [Nevskiaceae bacterium]
MSTPDPQTDPQTDPDTDRPRRHRRKWLIGSILVFSTLLLVAYAVYWLVDGRFHVETEDAYVHGNLVTLTPQISATVVKIAADDTDLVTAGQPLVTLDSSTPRIGLEHAKAALGAAIRDVEVLRQQADVERATIALRRTKRDQARRDYDRDKSLLAVHGVTVERFQHTETTWQTARQQYTQAQHQLAALEVQIQAPELRDIPQVALAIAQLHSAWLELQRTQIIAPASGFIAQRSVQVGKRVAIGKPLLTIVPLDDLWIEANFKETQIADIRIGQPARITADLYGSGIVYHGKVVGISAGTGAAFELLPPQNATGNWIKIMRRVPVRIALDPGELKENPLRIGLSMRVDVDISDTRGPRLATHPPTHPAYQTKVYDLSEAAFTTLVGTIITANTGGGAGVEATPTAPAR